MFDKMIDRLWELFTEMRMQQLETLPERVRAYFDLPQEEVTPEFVDQLAVSAYRAVMQMPTMLLTIIPLMSIAREAVNQRPEWFTIDELHRLMQQGFGEFSPLMKQATTREVVALTARLSLSDWIDADYASTTGEKLESDAHLYLNMAMEILKTTPDKEAMKLEAERVVPTITDADAAGLSSNARAALERLRREFRSDNDGS